MTLGGWGHGTGLKSCPIGTLLSAPILTLETASILPRLVLLDHLGKLGAHHTPINQSISNTGVPFLKAVGTNSFLNGNSV